MGGMGTLALAAFVCCTSLGLMIGLLWTGRNQRIQGRLDTLAGETRTPSAPSSRQRWHLAWLPKLGEPLLPTDEKGQTQLRSRLIQAGYYSRATVFIFLGVKMLLILGPLMLGVLVGVSGIASFVWAVLVGLIGATLGIVLPGIWLDSQKKKRQSVLRQGLPDALDMVGVCLRGGLSLQGAFQRVTQELAMAHPALAAEFAINQREVQLGRTTGEAMRHFAERCDLEEINSLASVIVQAERLGASATQALRIHADTLRVKRLQRAEELAHTAGTKMVFPTILCIFPAILLVVIGPAAYQIADLFGKM